MLQAIVLIVFRILPFPIATQMQAQTPLLHVDGLLKY